MSKKRKPLRKKICTECGKPFKTNMPKVVRCSKKCSDAHEKKRWLKNQMSQEKKTEDRNIIYNGYKEPFMPLKKEFYGYEGVVLEDADSGEIQCHICGRWFKSLAGHLRYHQDFLEGKNTHPLTPSSPIADSYKDFFGLKRGTALVSAGTREKIIEGQKGHPYWERSIESKKEWQRKQALVNKKGKGLNNNAVAEKKNEEGICYLQLLERILIFAIKSGRTPGIRDIKGSGGQDLSHTITRTYGSWGEALKILKLKKNRPGGRKKEKLTKAFLIGCLVNFIKRYGREPGGSDFRNEILPSKAVFQERFGSWERAMRLAQ